MEFYRTQIEPMTLKEALHEYYRLNAFFTPYQQLKSERARKLIRAHDISHLIFGCTTDLEGEMTVLLWKKYGVQVNLSLVEKIRYFLEFEALRLILNWQAVQFLLFRRKHFKRLESEVRKRSQTMKTKWRYFEEDAFLDQNVHDIRKQFNIAVI
jgi:ubiquinone biosynthesis protein Coq4